MALENDSAKTLNVLISFITLINKFIIGFIIDVNQFHAWNWLTHLCICVWMQKFAKLFARQSNQQRERSLQPTCLSEGRNESIWTKSSPGCYSATQLVNEPLCHKHTCLLVAIIARIQLLKTFLWLCNKMFYLSMLTLTCSALLFSNMNIHFLVNEYYSS